MYQSHNPVQLTLSVTMIMLQQNWIQPHLCFMLITQYMNVRWFKPVGGIET